MKKNYWLMKSEPNTYSIDNLKKDKKTIWDGVRNYQARNFMMHDMQVGDAVLFYHSSADPSGVSGIAKVSRKALPDPTQFDKKSKYYDPKSTKEKPRWYCVEVSYQEKFKNFVSLQELRKVKDLKDMLVLKKGQRLSIQPLQKKEFETVLKLGKK